MDPIPPAVPQRRRHIGRTIAFVTVGLVVLYIVGLLITTSTVKTTVALSAEERSLLESKAHAFDTLDVARRLTVQSRFVKRSGQSEGAAAEQYYVERYGLFHIKLSEHYVECWDFRSGIDGQPLSNSFVIGSRTGRLYCSDSIVF